MGQGESRVHVSVCVYERKSVIRTCRFSWRGVWSVYTVGYVDIEMNFDVPLLA